ncbi:MAG TPA: hypothetical protein VE127_12315 [Solirubrobacteraceae bacterium]|nr:hypothetical protein [Solirubrobacteraceae bacterium]
MGRWRLISIVAVVTGLLAIPVLASAGITTVTVRASVRGNGQLHKTWLTITRNRRTLYHRRVQLRHCAVGCTVTDLFPRRSPILVADLEGAREPNVVLGLFTGGAHCCFIDQVFSYDARRNTYVMSQHNFLDAGASIRRENGRYVFLSADARIAEDALTDYADSGMPIQIWRFAHRRFVDVTRAYPRMIRTDAARWLRLFRRHTQNGIGLIAAWAADEDLLGHSGLVRSTLAADARHNRLHSALMPHASGKSLAAQLQTLLRRLGYTR